LAASLVRLMWCGPPLAALVLHAHETPMLKPKHLGDGKAYPT
jgi:hypothetical protein